MTSLLRIICLGILGLTFLGAFIPGCESSPSAENLGGAGRPDDHPGGGDSSATEGSGGFSGEGGATGKGGSNASGGADGSGGSNTLLYPSAPACDDEVPCEEGGCYPVPRVCLECTHDGHCPTDHICLAERCHLREPCETSEDCSSEKPHCFHYKDHPGRCVECKATSDCPEDHQCRENSCTPTCMTDDDCPAPLGTCESLRCGECTLDRGCTEDEYCHKRTCRPKVCLPGTIHCLGTRTVECNEHGSGYTNVSSCSTFPCQVINGRGHCSFPDGNDDVPVNAVNTNGHLTGTESAWRLHKKPLPLSNGMFCFTNTLSPEYEQFVVTWPADLEDAATLVMDQDYVLTFRTSVIRLKQTAPKITFAVEVSNPENSNIYLTTDVEISEGVQDHALPFTMYRHDAPAGIKFTMTSTYAELCLDNVWIVAEN